jgi:hypothetical protein
MKLKNIFFLTFFLFGQAAFAESKIGKLGSNLNPLSFGDDQTIVDLKKVIWKPLNVDGLAPGAEIAVLRGNLQSGPSESLLRLPPGYKVPLHHHTSDELYIWIEGAFTLITHDQTQTKFDGAAYINFPGNAPPHGLKCGIKKHCILYLKYSRPFDIKYPSK